MSQLPRTCVALVLLLTCRLAAAATITGRLDLDALPDTLTYGAPDEEGTVTLTITLATADGKGRTLVRRHAASEGHMSVRSTVVSTLCQDSAAGGNRVG